MGISEELDELSCELMGEALDKLAAGEMLVAVAAAMDEQGIRTTCAFEDDSPEQCLLAAREWVADGAKGNAAARGGKAAGGGKSSRGAKDDAGAEGSGGVGVSGRRGSSSAADASMGKPSYYAIAYAGAIADEEGGFVDALILEFGEKGSDVAYSAYSLVEGVGAGDDFRYTDPAPAGEMPCLL